MENRLLLGPFELIRPIGKGSMGVVWEGVHRAQNYPVAVKLMTGVGVGDENFRQSFLNEVRAVARLHHPSIIEVLDYGVTDDALYEASGGEISGGSQYCAMELATGGTLPRPKHALAWLQMRYLLLQLLDALAHAHARDVIHRDIKPSNILLMRERAHFRAMLTDFGIAKAVGVKGLPEGVVVGTPRYMAPEQILDQTREQGPWTDLYSLGCVAYLLATGRRIFSHASGTEVFRCHLQEEPEPVSGRHLPSGFSGWLSKMLAKKPSRRFEFAAEAAWALLSLDDEGLVNPESGVSGIQDGVMDSGDGKAVNAAGVNSSVFSSLYDSGQVASIGGKPQVCGGLDIADDLLADMGDTMRMDSEDIAQVISQQTRAAQERDEQMHELSTLAQLYRTRFSGISAQAGASAVPVPKTWRREAFETDACKLLGAGLGLWGFRTIPMVDRDAERDLIYAQILSVREDRRKRCMILDGPRGAGKSRIIEWMSQRAHELSIARTLKALHYREHIQAPGIVRAMMYYLECQNLTRDAALERVETFLGDHPLVPEYDDALAMVELMRLSDNPEHPVAGIHFEDIHEQYRVLSRFLRRITGDRPVILWMDDLHFSQYSMSFLQFLFSSPDLDIPVLVLSSLRSEELVAGSPEAMAYASLLACDGVTKLDISPLTPDAQLALVHELLGLDDDLCYQVMQRTGGMPLFAIQLVGDWIERGVLEPGKSGFKVKDGASIELPDSLHELWLSRLNVIFQDRRVYGHAIEQLEVAACLGRQFDADEWRIACELGEFGTTAKTLECMISHRLCELRYPVVEFSHELLEESLIRHAKENGRYQAHHLLCAEMLEMYFSEALTFYHERRGEHLFKAQAWEACIEPLLLAGNFRRQRGEFGVAHMLFSKREEAIDACHADGDSPIRALGWIAEADTLIQEVRLDEAEPYVNRSIELGVRTKSPVIQALAYKERGQLLQLRNTVAESIDALMTALTFFNQISDRRRMQYLSDRAETLWLIGRICDVRHELDLARIYLQQAIEIQIQIGDQYGLGRSYKALGNTFLHGGMYEEARVNIEYALKIFEQMGYRLYIANCLNDIGEIYRLGYHRPEEAERWYRSAMEKYREVNAIDGSTAVINLVLLLLVKQRFTEAKPLVVEQIELLEKSGKSFDLNWLYAELLPCCAATFDWPTFDKTVLLLGKALEDSTAVDADILYCTDLAYQLCERYATREQGALCREIAIEQAVKLNDKSALARLSR